METKAEQHALEAQQLPSFKSLSLPDIKEKVEQMLGLIGRSGIFSSYTDHSIKHINAMLKMLEWLIPPSTQAIMKPTEWLILVLAIYLHDLGMLVTEKEYRDRKENAEYVKWFDGLGKDTPGKEYLARTRRMNKEEKERFFSRSTSDWDTQGESANGSPASIHENGAPL